MRKFLLVVIVMTALNGCVTARGVTPGQIATADYGPVPSNPEEIVRQHLNNFLVDPASLRDLEVGPPIKAYTAGSIFTDRGYVVARKGMFGYVVIVRYNAKNRMGGYVGKKSRFAFVSGNTVDFMIDRNNFQADVIKFAP